MPVDPITLDDLRERIAAYRDAEAELDSAPASDRFIFEARLAAVRKRVRDGLLGLSVDDLVGLIGDRDAKPGNTVAFIEALAHEIRTQDSAATAHPYMLVQERVRLYGYDPAWSDRTTWIDYEGEEIDDEERERLERAYAKRMETPSGYTRTGYVDRWVTRQAFLTRKGAEDYIRVNGHNHGQLRVYVESAYRNYEIIELRKAIKALAGEERDHG